ncbi:hypothetical protein B0H13DRAFT_2378135 [Mycena leptocephala]|nr:hypothetical protein B0H13DRAFT_2378135 [Mycena leptocephala]
MIILVPKLEQELFRLLTDARTTNELAVAALALVIIDISFMLRAEWSDHLCKSFLFGEMVTCTIIVISTDLILVFRVWILYGRPRKLLYLMVPLITAEIIAMITVGVKTIAALEQYVHVGPILGGCYSLEVPRLFTFYAVPPFVTAVLMFLMTAYKCGTTLMALGPRRTPVIALFLRDGLFWFLANLLVSIVEIVLWDRARATLAQIPVIPSTAVIAVIGARVVLNIKHIAANTTMVAVTTMGTELEVRHPGATRTLDGIDTLKYAA